MLPALTRMIPAPLYQSKIQVIDGRGVSKCRRLILNEESVDIHHLTGRLLRCLQLSQITRFIVAGNHLQVETSSDYDLLLCFPGLPEFLEAIRRVQFIPIDSCPVGYIDARIRERLPLSEDNSPILLGEPNSSDWRGGQYIASASADSFSSYGSLPSSIADSLTSVATSHTSKSMYETEVSNDSFLLLDVELWVSGLRKARAQSELYAEIYSPNVGVQCVIDSYSKTAKHDVRLKFAGTAPRCWEMVYRTEYLKLNRSPKNPRWRRFRMSMQQLGSDMNKPLHIDCYSFDVLGAQTYIGSARCHIRDLFCQREITMEILRDKSSKGKKPTNCGTLHILAKWHYASAQIATA